MTDLTINRGNSKTYRLSFVGTSGAAIDITGWTVLFTVKKNVNLTDTEAAISKTVTSHSDPTGGVTLIVLSTSDTDITPGPYLYDYGYVDTSGVKKTTDPERFTVIGSVTRRVS